MKIKHLVAITVFMTAAICGRAQTSAALQPITFNPQPQATTSAEAAAQEPLTATRAFTEAPAAIFPTLDRMTRLDMVDYFNSGSPKPSKNAFKGDSRIIAASDRSITIATSDVSEIQLSLLESGNDTILMVITTLKTPAPDSGVRFYTTRWKEITKGLFMVPLLDDWMLPEAQKRRDDLENTVPFVLASITYDPQTATLTLKNNLGDFLPDDDSKWVSPLLRSQLVYKWNGKKMTK